MRVSILISAFNFVWVSVVSAATLNFGGVPLRPGATVRAQVPLSEREKAYVSEYGDPPPPYAVAEIAVPPGFDPAKSWPVLVVLSTSDFKTKNRDDLERLYQWSAFAEGWVVLAGDAEGNPRHDTAGWRAGTTLAAIDALHRGFPSSKNWPVAVAGFSGGAKRAQSIAPLLAAAGCRVTGIFLTGINEEFMAESYRLFQPGAAFLRTPIYISSGQLDIIATPAQQQHVKQLLEKSGFTRVREVMTMWGHGVSRSAVREALRWFRQEEGTR